MLTVSFLQPIILKADKVQQGQGRSLGGCGWKGNSLFAFAIRYFRLAHEAACEAGPSVYFSLILQDLKVSANGLSPEDLRFLSQIQQRNVGVILPLKQNKKPGGEEDYFFCFSLPQLYGRLYCSLLSLSSFPLFALLLFI